MPVNYTELGLDTTQAKATEKAVKEMIAKEFIPLERFNEVNGKLKQAETDITTRDTQLKELGTAGVDAETLKTELAKIKIENETAAKKYADDIANIKRGNAIDKAVEGAKARNSKAVKALLDMDKIKLDGETVIGLSEQLKALSEGEDSKFLFGTEETVVVGGTPAGASGGADPNPGGLSIGQSHAAKYNAMFEPAATK